VADRQAPWWCLASVDHDQPLSGRIYRLFEADPVTRNAVNTCPGLFVDDSVDGLVVDNWRVKMTGGKGNVDEVRVQFIRATPDDATPDDLEVEVTLQLIDRGPYDFDGEDTFLPVAVDKPKTYTLNNYSIFGSSLKGEHPRLKCDNTGDDTLERGIDLVITLTTAPAP